MSAIIDTLKNKLGVFVYPKTLTKAVYDETTQDRLDNTLGSATLTTTAQNLKGAINELDNILGSTTLTTTAQTATSAINELKSLTTTMKLISALQYSAASTYILGEYVIYNDVFYKCTTAITVAEPWTIGHWTATNLGNELSTTNTNLGDKSTLNTTDKSNLVNAINEVNTNLGTTNALKADKTALANTDARVSNLVATSGTSFYEKTTNGTANALLIVASGATTGQINLASVTPVATGYTAVAGDYVHLVNGLSAGNTELMDARLGADNRTYSNVGESARRNIKLLTDIKNNSTITLNYVTEPVYRNDSYVDDVGDDVGDNVIVKVNGTGHKVIKLSLSNISNFTMINGTTAPTVSYGTIFKSDGTRRKTLPASSNGIEYKIFKDFQPTDYVLLNYLNGTYCNAITVTYTNGIDSLGINVLKSFNDYITNNGFYKNNGVLVQLPDANAWLYSDFIEIYPYSKLKYGTVMFNSDGTVVDNIVFWTKDKVFISSIHATTTTTGTYVEGECNIPDNAYYVTFSIFNDTQHAKYHIVDGYVDVGKIINKVSNLQIKASIKVYKHCVNKPYVFSGESSAYFGDSIVQGFIDMGVHTTENGFPKLFSDKVGMSFINMGVGGSCYTSGLNEVTTVLEKIQAAVQAAVLTGRKFMFVAAGVNDWQLGGNLSAFETAVTNTFDYIKNNFTGNVIIIAPINTCYTNKEITSLDEYRNILGKQAILHEFSFINGGLFNFPSESGTLASTVFGDGYLHCSELGYRLYSKELQTVLC